MDITKEAAVSSDFALSGMTRRIYRDFFYRRERNYGKSQILTFYSILLRKNLVKCAMLTKTQLLLSSAVLNDPGEAKVLLASVLCLMRGWMHEFCGNELFSQKCLFVFLLIPKISAFQGKRGTKSEKKSRFVMNPPKHP